MRLGRMDGFRVEQLMLKTAQTIQERNTLRDNERQIFINAPLELRLVVALRKVRTHIHTWLWHTMPIRTRKYVIIALLLDHRGRIERCPTDCNCHTHLCSVRVFAVSRCNA